MTKETSKKYHDTFGEMWGVVDEYITELIIAHTKKNDHLLEVGFGSGHYLAALQDSDRIMTGIEIREDAYTETSNRLLNHYSDIELIYGDVMDLKGRYDLVYSTGLIQCKDENDRWKLLEHISRLANKVIYTVPRIDKNRNVSSIQRIGVSGCTEFVTGNISYELSDLYSYVEEGIWNKDIIGLDDDFVWIYCDGARTKGGNL